MKSLLLKLTKNAPLKRLALFLFSVLFSALLLMEIRDFVRTKKLLNGIVTKIIAQPNAQGEMGLVKNTLATVRTLSKPRTDFFQGELQYSDDYLEAFFAGSGACGMYTLFTCRLLTELGYDCRVVQQRVDSTWGGHITLEVDLNRFNKSQPARWMLTDPLFNHMFLDTQQRELSADAVKSLWPETALKTQGQYDISQLPADYDIKYNYQQGFRYTNWDKLGPVSRGIYHLGKFFQLPMDTFSFRAVFIRQHFWNIAIYGFGLLVTLFVALRARMKMAFKKLGV